MEPCYRVVTASSLFDGHDASINVFRRLLQQAGLEVIHLGHNRGVDEIVTTAIQEDADAICVSSYQGGHMEFFRYMVDQLKERNAGHIRVFGGGGGTILPQEIQELEDYGVSHIYHAEEGQKIGLKGIIDHLVANVKRKPLTAEEFASYSDKVPLNEQELARVLTLIERGGDEELQKMRGHFLGASMPETPIIGITGPGGAGKSSLVDELITRYLQAYDDRRIAVLAFDPTKRKTGGALLGDRIRMNAVYNSRVFLRSMSTGMTEGGVSDIVQQALEVMKLGGFDLIILETSGIGQGSARVVDICDLSLYVMTSEYGASTQLEKIDMIDFADFVVINKFDKMGAEDSFDDVCYAYANSRGFTMRDKETFPIYGTIASDFNDPGVSKLFQAIMNKLDLPVDYELPMLNGTGQAFHIIPRTHTNYLSEVAETVRQYHEDTEEKRNLASDLYQCTSLLGRIDDEPTANYLQDRISALEMELSEQDREGISAFFDSAEKFRHPRFSYRVRNRTITRDLRTSSLSGSEIPKVAVPDLHDWGDVYEFTRKENFPGEFPYTAGVFPIKQEEEDPKRQFAGEGSPERTNKRFHYLCEGELAHRLSTAFDSVTLYGEDPCERMDIYGKVGNSGVSIATLDHMKALYNGFDLIHPRTSVSLTINGPAPMILAMFFNTAIDFEVEKRTGKKREELAQEEFLPIRDEVLARVRGTVQADILKEEQAQNTCIFSSKFALKMMGDIQEYFIDHQVRGFYSVSISGYHIAEAGANPITQLAFTLANGFTILEYYLARGMDVDEVAPNLSFFFSMGLDPEYSVIGRVARRIWAIAIRDRYGGNARSQKLKYHVQTSGRSLHAQEIAFNDIRTTLQALMATNDFCNSLHTNAYDEAVTTPTEESVRRAMAIQLIINREFGTAKCENTLQGSYFYEELTDMVEEAVLKEFDAISRRGGVLGAMEKQYQRHRIQTESMLYEEKKASGDLPIIGVNTFLSDDNTIDYGKMEVIRATDEEKLHQIQTTRDFIERAGSKNTAALEKLRQTALSGGNIFEELMQTVRYASLGQITQVLYACGGEYRRSM